MTKRWPYLSKQLLGLLVAISLFTGCGNDEDPDGSGLDASLHGNWAAGVDFSFTAGDDGVNLAACEDLALGAHTFSREWRIKVGAIAGQGLGKIEGSVERDGAALRFRVETVALPGEMPGQGYVTAKRGDALFDSFFTQYAAGSA